MLRASDAGRAIFVTSGAARDTHPYWGAYAVAKAGLEMLVRLYAAETAKSTVRANLIDPGVVRTRLRADAYPGEDASVHPPPEAVTPVDLAFVELAMAERHDQTGRHRCAGRLRMRCSRRNRPGRLVGSRRAYGGLILSLSKDEVRAAPLPWPERNRARMGRASWRGDLTPGPSRVTEIGTGWEVAGAKSAGRLRIVDDRQILTHLTTVSGGR